MFTSTALILAFSIAVTGSTLPPNTVIRAIVEPAAAQTDAWDCIVRGWVRAPDLAPDMRTQADARLVLADGNDCGNIRRWDVGLRLFERSVFKFRAPGLVIPEEPFFNHSQHHQSHQRNDSIFVVNNNFSPFGRGDKDPAILKFEAKQAEYAAALQDTTMWIAKSSERKVFDEVLELQTLPDDVHSFPNKSVKSFAVHVPATNFPPVLRQENNQWFSDEVEISVAETMFEYYFRLALRNGSTIEYPVGHTGFIPGQAEGDAAVESTSDVTLRLDLLNPRKDRPEDGNDLWYPRPRRGRKRYQSYGPPPPHCDKGNLAEFTIDIDIPGKSTFTLGQQIALNVTVRRHGNGTEVPTHISLKHSSCQSLTWAASYAHSEDLRDMTSGCQAADYYGPSDNRLAMVPPFDPESFQRQLKERRRSCDGLTHSVGISTSSWISGEEFENGTKLDPQSEVQSVMVNLSIPTDAVPTFLGTYRDYISEIAVNLYTKFECDQGGGVANVNDEDVDPEDALWDSIKGRSWKCPRQVRTSRHKGKSSAIRVVTNVDVVSKDYRDKDALAPRLVTSNHHGAITFSPVNIEQKEEIDPQTLYRRKYGVDLRVPRRRPTSRCRNRCAVPGGEYSHVGMAWQHNLLRAELVSLEKDVEDGYSSGARNPLGDNGAMLVIQEGN